MKSEEDPESEEVPSRPSPENRRASHDTAPA